VAHVDSESSVDHGFSCFLWSPVYGILPSTQLFILFILFIFILNIFLNKKIQTNIFKLLFWCMKYLNIFCVSLYYNYSLIFFYALKEDILNVKSILIYLGWRYGDFFFLMYNLFKIKIIFLKIKYIYFLCRSHKKLKSTLN